MFSDSKSSLDAGLTALKQGDIQTAKNILEAVATTENNSWAAIQAQIGLVVAYARSGDVTAAITLSEILAQSNNQEVKQWAQRSLEELHKRGKEVDVANDGTENEADITGFAAFDENSLTSDLGNKELLSTNLDADADADADVINTPKAFEKTKDSRVIPVTRPFKPPTIHWRQAGRAKNWKSQEKLNLIWLRLLSIGTFVAFFWVLRELLILAMATINNFLVWLPFFEPIQLLYQNPTVLLLSSLVILTAISPWLLDQLLKSFYDLRHLQKDALDLHSKESVRLIQRFCQQRRFQFLELGILPIAAPIAFSYGTIPQTARIVVSQGLLQQLSDDEIAVVYAGQLAQIAHWDVAIMSLVLLVTIPIYKLYQLLSNWGDRVGQRFVNFIYIGLSSCVYGVWCLCVGSTILLSQVRLYYADSFACDFTGNPNALARALLKISVGIANDIQKQEKTSWQLESLNIFIPVGFKQSITLGSLAPHIAFESLLMWDYLNPYRYFLAINNTHPLIGDRIGRTMAVARRWHLEPELDIETQSPIRVRKQLFYLQIAPFLGIPIGLLFAGLIGLVWQVAFALKILNLKWIYDDWDFGVGCILICFSICTLIRVNSFFPELNQSSNLYSDEHLANLLDNPAAIPIDQVTVSVSGKLLGRRGTSNSLGQDLILQTNTALLKLHHISWLGQALNPQDFIGRHVVVKGWLRRGATHWLDIQSLETQTGKTINSPHPIWSTIVAVAAVAWGAVILLKG